MARQNSTPNIYRVRNNRSSGRHSFGFPLAVVLCIALGFGGIYSGVATSVWREVRQAVAPAQVMRAGDFVAARSFFACANSRTLTCVVDGDTIRLNGDRIRISDIDTPEVFSPQCPEELALGNRATRRMVQLLSAGSFEMLRFERDKDVYGRKLRVLVRDGQSIGQLLVAEGLARTWDGARHPWC